MRLTLFRCAVVEEMMWTFISMQAYCGKRDTLISCIFQHILVSATVIEKRISYPIRALLRTTNRPYAAQNSLCQSVVYSSANST
jgi:hypothetical protein